MANTPPSTDDDIEIAIAKFLVVIMTVFMTLYIVVMNSECSGSLAKDEIAMQDLENIMTENIQRCSNEKSQCDTTEQRFVFISETNVTLINMLAKGINHAKKNTRKITLGRMSLASSYRSDKSHKRVVNSVLWSTGHKNKSVSVTVYQVWNKSYMDAIFNSAQVDTHVSFIKKVKNDIIDPTQNEKIISEFDGLMAEHGPYAIVEIYTGPAMILLSLPEDGQQHRAPLQEGTVISVGFEKYDMARGYSGVNSKVSLIEGLPVLAMVLIIVVILAKAILCNGATCSTFFIISLCFCGYNLTQLSFLTFNCCI